MLERVRVEFIPLVSDLREVRGETEKIRKQRDADGFSWTVLVVLCSGLGGVVGAKSCWRCAGDLRDRRFCWLWDWLQPGRGLRVEEPQ